MTEMRSVGAIFPGRISISIMGFLTEPLPATRLSGSRLSMAISGWLAVSQSSQWAAEGVVHKGRDHQFLMPKEDNKGIIKETGHNRKGKLHFILNMIHNHFSAIFDEKAFKPQVSHGKKTMTFFVNCRNYLSCFKVWLFILENRITGSIYNMKNMKKNSLLYKIVNYRASFYDYLWASLYLCHCHNFFFLLKKAIPKVFSIFLNVVNVLSHWSMLS